MKMYLYSKTGKIGISYTIRTAQLFHISRKNIKTQILFIVYNITILLQSCNQRGKKKSKIKQCFLYNLGIHREWTTLSLTFYYLINGVAVIKIYTPIK